MAAAPRALVQRTPLAATPGGPQVVRSIVAPAKRALGRTELQATGTQHPGSEPIPPRPIAELPATGGIPPDSFTSLQANGTLYSQSVNLVAPNSLNAFGMVVSNGIRTFISDI